MGRRLPVLVEEQERTALAARWPEPVLALSESERAARVRAGSDSVMFTEVDGDKRTTRGFVRAVLRVPHDHPKGAVYGVFVEVDRASYASLKDAHKTATPVRVWGKLATRLPYLEAAYGSRVQILEDGSEMRARVVAVESELLTRGPAVGPMSR
jgi:hypothetical protein